MVVAHCELVLKTLQAEGSTLISIIILTHNRLNFTLQCLDSIRAHTPEPHEVIVVDNGSTDGTPEFLQRQPDVRAILNEQNRGFPAGCNQGIAAAQGDWLVLLNNDMVVVPRWLTNILSCQQASGAGMVGPCCNHIAGAQRVSVPYTDTGEGLLAFAEAFTQPNPGRWRRAARLGGGGLLVLRQVLDRIGHLDERFTPGNYEDDDLSLRALVAGIPLFIAGDSFVHHYGGNVFKAPDPAYADLLVRNGDRFCLKWGVAKPNLLYGNPQLAERVPPEAHRVLDCACGAGALGLLLKQRGHEEVVGLEEHSELALAAGHLLDRVTEGPPVEADLPPSHFDAVVIPDLLEHMVNPWGFLARVEEWLRPGGTVLLTVSNAAFIDRVVSLLGGRPRYRPEEPWLRRDLRSFTLGELGAALEAAGLRVQAVLGAGREFSETEHQLAGKLVPALQALGADPALETLLRIEEFWVTAVKGGG